MATARPDREEPLNQRDLEFVPDDGNLYEVIDGKLHVTPFPGYRHQNAITQLVSILNAFTRQHDLGRVFTSGLKVVLGEPTGVGPDVVYIARDRMAHMREDGYYGAPDLLVEVVSSKPRLDRVIKYDAYARAGVPHYWIVDPVASTLEAWRLRGEAYDRVALAQDAEPFAPELFPGLVINTGELWV